MHESEDMNEPISSQKYVCVSFLSEEDENIDDQQEIEQETNIIGAEGLRNKFLTSACPIVKKVFDTKEEADEYTKCFSELNPNFDYYVAEIVDDIERS